MNIHIQNLEKIVLSSLMTDYTLIEDIIDFINVDDFYNLEYQEVYKTIQYLYNNELPVEELFIRKYANKEILNDTTILDLVSTLPITKITNYANEIKENSKKRKLEKLSLNIKTKSLEDKYLSDDIIAEIQLDLDNIETISKDKYEYKTIDLLNTIQDEMLNIKNDGKKEIFKTGITKLDNLLEGIDDGELVIIAARPSMGKTSLISNICIETLKMNRGVLIESLEMDAKKIMRRLLATKSEEALSDIKKGIVRNLKNFENAIDFFSTEDLIIHDESYITLYQLQSKIKRSLRKNPNIKNVLIDHTGKIKLSGKTREDIEIGHITNSLKKIAREYKIRIFLLQQLNRTVESRDNKRPILSDLKNSGNIEEDADIVLGLYRESYYKTKEKDIQEKDLEPAEIIILKNRDGRIGTAKIYFEKETSSFRNKDFKEEIKIVYDK